MQYKKSKFNITDTVWHVLPDGDRGVIIDIRYYFLHDYYEYFVTFGVGRTGWFLESELSATRIF